MNLSKCLSCVSALLLCCLTMTGQTTKVRGRVTDASTGESVPFAAVMFKGTDVGITTDFEGFYSLETRDPGEGIITCQLLGYDSQEKHIRVGQFSTVDFALVTSDNRLSGAVVKPDNSRIKRILSEIDKRRAKNNPEGRNYVSQVYNKMELDLTNAKEQLSHLKKFSREFSFLFDYMDTSSVSGVPYLPAMISETVYLRNHTTDPELENETIIANRISGINPENNLLTPFTSSMLLKVNFYDNFINTFGVEFPSPIQASGLLYYNYYIIDSLQVDGRKTLLVRYHPKSGISSPTFDGEMQIDEEDWALRKINAKMKHGGNVNWVRDIVLDLEYSRAEDGIWFYKNDRMYVDLSMMMRDSSKMMSFIGTRQLAYTDVSFESPGDIRIDVADGRVTVDAEANRKTDAYWEDVRPYQLTPKEKDVYKMVDQFEDTRLYRTAYDVIYTIVNNGYYELGPISLGPIFQCVSTNNLEGVRLQAGVRTSRDFSKKHRLGAYVAYGTKDHDFKGGLTYEWVINREKTQKFTFDACRDLFQLSRGTSSVTDGNILASALGKGGSNRRCMFTKFSTAYEHEFSMNVNCQFEASMRRFWGNQFVPMFRTDGSPVTSVASNELMARIRFSKDETVNRGYYKKVYVGTLKPVVSLQVTGSIPGLREGDCGFICPELSLKWRLRIPPLGFSRIEANAGTIIGQVPYPYLHLHEGNSTYMYDRTAFSTMDFFEFASDTWATLFWYHSFDGFFLGKIPLIRKLNLRETFTFRAAYGTLSDKNNPLIPGSTAVMAFPEGMNSLGSVPYIEMGCGISNIFRFLKVDFLWRMTHREKIVNGQTIPARTPFVVNVGAEFRF